MDSQSSPARPGKRLIIACDGTWADSDNGFVKDSWLPWESGGHLQIPTNVTRVCRALVPKTTDGIPQIVYYQAGIGSEDNSYSFFVGGYLGAGISENIREAYAFVATNYEPGDQIFLIGFSRGAFTARSIGGLISSIGLLTRKGLEDFYPLFKDWMNQNVPGWKNPLPFKFFNIEPKPKYSDPAYTQELEKLGLTRLNIPIEAVAVWDTVGTLGVPDLGPLKSSTRKEYSFVNTEVAPNIRHAFQALALDEDRKPFSPTVWELPAPGTPTSLVTLKQTWFPGTHANVGGSFPDTGLADLTLAWMLAQLAPHLEFSEPYVLWQQELNRQWFAHQKPAQEPRPWGCGQIYVSDGLLDVFTGKAPRSPGEYHATDPMTGVQLPRLLRDTREFVHPCVRVRMDLRGKGRGDTPVYKPQALKGWKLVKPMAQFGEVAQGSKAGSGSGSVNAIAGTGDDTRGGSGSGGGGGTGKDSGDGNDRDEPWGPEWDGWWKWAVKRKDGGVIWIAEDRLVGVEQQLCAAGSEARARVDSAT